ncbi:TPA: hypothetical protein L5995_23515 [Pseudomonas aeruginosa]|nr:hypothetical protein [Pseudomonas aeruginosa]HBP6246344.1 hypothetical protein [Pseudomonas aeruginosa]
MIHDRWVSSPANSGRWGAGVRAGGGRPPRLPSSSTSRADSKGSRDQEWTLHWHAAAGIGESSSVWIRPQARASSGPRKRG